MHFHCTLILAATLLPYGSTLARPEDFPCRASEGETIERTFVHKRTSILESMSMLMDGEEGPGMGGMDSMEQESTAARTLRMRDVIRAADAGRANAIARTYLHLEGESSFYLADPMGGEQHSEVPEESELAGQTVLFEADDQSFTADWGEGSAGSLDLLQDLEMSLDLELLMPPDAVEPGEQWSVPLELLEVLRSPGGDVGLRGADAEAPVVRGEDDGHDGEVDGSIDATFLEVREVNGQRFAAVELNVDVSKRIDMTDFMLPGSAEDEGMPEGMIAPEIKSLVQESLLTGEGLFLWDLSAGRLRSLELECELEEIQEMVMVMDMGGREREMTQLSESAGSESWQVTCEY